MRKFTKAEGSAIPITPKHVEAVNEVLKRLEKNSACDLTDEEREEFNSALDKSDSD